jgi:hypothetical protein
MDGNPGGRDGWKGGMERREGREVKEARSGVHEDMPSSAAVEGTALFRFVFLFPFVDSCTRFM